MSGNDPKDTDSVETNETDERAETSRRSFISGSAAAVAGAVAVVGAAAGTTVPKEAQAQGVGPRQGIWELRGTEVVRVDDVYYGSNAELADDLREIYAAYWGGYKTSTTAPPSDVPAALVQADLMSEDWSVVRARMTDITEGVPANRGAFSPDKPRVITREMYNNGYLKRDFDEVVFVLLPQPIGVANSKGTQGGSVRALMASVPFGM